MRAAKGCSVPCCLSVGSYDFVRCTVRPPFPLVPGRWRRTETHSRAWYLPPSCASRAVRSSWTSCLHTSKLAGWLAAPSASGPAPASPQAARWRPRSQPRRLQRDLRSPPLAWVVRCQKARARRALGGCDASRRGVLLSVAWCGSRTGRTDVATPLNSLDGIAVRATRGRAPAAARAVTQLLHAQEGAALLQLGLSPYAGSFLHVTPLVNALLGAVVRCMRKRRALLTPSEHLQAQLWAAALAWRSCRLLLPMPRLPCFCIASHRCMQALRCGCSPSMLASSKSF